MDIGTKSGSRKQAIGIVASKNGFETDQAVIAGSSKTKANIIWGCGPIFPPNIHRHTAAGTTVIQKIRKKPANQRVIPKPTHKRVVVDAAIQPFIPIGAEQTIIAIAAGKPPTDATGNQGVGKISTFKRFNRDKSIIARRATAAARAQISKNTAGGIPVTYPVIAVAGINRIMAAAGNDGVIAFGGWRERGWRNRIIA